MLPISFKVATVTVVLKDILAYGFHLQMTASIYSSCLIFCIHECMTSCSSLLSMHVQAENGELRVDWPWYPNGIHGQMAENFQRDDDEQFLYNPTTGSRETIVYLIHSMKKTPLTQLIRCVVFLASDNLLAR